MWIPSCEAMLIRSLKWRAEIAFVFSEPVYGIKAITTEGNLGSGI